MPADCSVAGCGLGMHAVCGSTAVGTLASTAPALRTPCRDDRAGCGARPNPADSRHLHRCGGKLGIAQCVIKQTARMPCGIAAPTRPLHCGPLHVPEPTPAEVAPRPACPAVLVTDGSLEEEVEGPEITIHQPEEVLQVTGRWAGRWTAERLRAAH